MVQEKKETSTRKTTRKTPVKKTLKRVSTRKTVGRTSSRSANKSKKSTDKTKGVSSLSEGADSKEVAYHVVVQTAPGLETPDMSRCVATPRLGVLRKRVVVKKPLDTAQIDYSAIKTKSSAPLQKKVDSKVSPWPFLVRRREITPEVQDQMAALGYLGLEEDDIDLLGI